MKQRGWIKAEWGVSETKRRARFYRLTEMGRDEMKKETENWKRIAGTMARFLGPGG